MRPGSAALETSAEARAQRSDRLLAEALREYDAGRLREAEMLLREILTLDANHADGLHLLGLITHRDGQYDAAAEWIRKAIAANGKVAAYYSNLGNALQAQGSLDEAVAQYKQALELHPKYAVACHNLGCALQAQRKWDEAATYYERGIALDPGRVEAHVNLDICLREQGRLEEAVACCERALALRPKDAEACNRLGFALQAQGRFGEALVEYKRATALRPAYDEAVWNRSLVELLLGDFAAGWANYERRWSAGGTPRNLTQPQWRGEPLGGARILLHAEQGLGDTVQFLRYVPMVQAAGGAVVLEVQAGLRRIAEHLPGVEVVVAGDALPECAWQCPLMSLPLVFGTAVDTIPAHTPYLTVPAEALDRAAGLPWPTAALRVGLVWAGNPEHRNDRSRSIALSLLEALFGIEGVQFFSLQMGVEAEQLAMIDGGVIDLRYEIGDMADTAALMTNLDLVIAVDTSVVHLAGALGRPTWLLLPFAPDWRWMLEREDSPWYPTMRLFRQTERDGWEPVVERLRAALGEELAAARRGRMEPVAGGQRDVRRRGWGESAAVRGLFNAAIGQHRDGHLDEADGLYRQILNIDYRHADSWHLLGMIAFKRGCNAEAVEKIREAIAIDGNQASYHSNLGNVLRAEDKHEEAVGEYRRAAELKPDFVEAHYNLGLVLQILGRLDEAVASHERALALKPDAAVYFELGRALQAQGKLNAAQKSFEQALALKPDYAEGYAKLGAVLQAKGKVEEAPALYGRALVLKPELVEACCNLGTALQLLGKLAPAEVLYRRAIALKPEFVEAWLNLGLVLTLQGKLDEAVGVLERTVALKPDSAEAYANLGVALQDQGRLTEAVASYRRALAIRADLAVAHQGLLFCLSHSGEVSLEALFEEHLRFAEVFERPLRAAWPRHGNVRDSERSLRVGFVSGDFCTHAMSNFIEPVLAHLSQDAGLSLHAYATRAAEDEVTKRMRAHVPSWHRVFALSDAALAAKIQADEIDILVDLTGHSAPSRMLMFARKPAPVQCGWIGYLGSSGLACMDYYLGDRYFLPPGEFDRYFTEKIVQLPVVAPFEASAEAPEVNPLPALTNGFVTFGSFSRRSKLNRQVIALWSELLRAVPSAHMLLAGMPRESRNESLTRWFEEEGIAVERLQFHTLCGGQEYLGLHHQVDMCLDPFPFTGATTTCNALWMGVPTLTWMGQTVAGRLGPALLRHAGLDAFVARTAQDFVDKGTRWAGDCESLSELRAGMRARFRESPIGQPAEVAQSLADALREMWRRWCGAKD
jgi:predicted O-linked N-acetylglucosamine transferase (SPINDLY family)